MFAWQPWSSFQGWQSRVRVSITFLWVCSSTFVAELRAGIQKIIRTILERLKDSDYKVRNEVIYLLSGLAMQGMS